MAARHELGDLRRTIARLAIARPGAACARGRDEPSHLRIGAPEIDRHLSLFGLAPGGVHEIAGSGPDEEQGAMGTGFLALWLRHCAPTLPILWASPHADLYPPGLAGLGLEPGRLIQIDARREKEIGWVLEEGLRCAGLGAVVGEMARIDLTASRRLQLAAEKIGIPCFILRRWPSADLARHHRRRPIAAVTRWRIQPAPGAGANGELANTGKTRWLVDLWRCRNGRSASWFMEVAHAGEHSPLVTAVPVDLADPLADGLPDEAQSTLTA